MTIQFKRTRAGHYAVMLDDKQVGGIRRRKGGGKIIRYDDWYASGRCIEPVARDTLAEVKRAVCEQLEIDYTFPLVVDDEGNTKDVDLRELDDAHLHAIVNGASAAGDDSTVRAIETIWESR